MTPPLSSRSPVSLPRRLGAGLLAGLVGAAAVDAAGRLAQVGGLERRPTLPALLVAKTVRMPGASNRRRGRARRALSTTVGLEHPDGAPDPARLEGVGTAAHYLWGSGWGLARVALDTRRGVLSAALTHFVVFSAADHALLAATNVGTPIWAPRQDSDTRSRDAAHQLGQLVLYTAATNLTYAALRTRG